MSEVFDNRYRVVEKLGEGGMAEVFHVLDTTAADRPLAYKVLKGRREHLEHFRHEFRVLSRLTHPNLIKVHDFGLTEDGAAVYYTAEYVEGRDLFTASQDLDYDQLYDVVVQIARGLAYIHARGLIHYDIKPENILVRSDPAFPPAAGARGGEPPHDLVKIMDFGLTGEEEARTDRIKGTVHYLAPEIARGAPHDRRIDLYSLGVTLYHCLARRLPYDGGSTFSVIRKHLESIPEPPTRFNVQVPRPWEEFVLRLMAKEPGDRPASAGEALADLAERLGRRPVLDTKETLEGYLLSARFVGRERERLRLRRAVATLVEAGRGDGGKPRASGRITLPPPRASGRITAALQREVDAEPTPRVPSSIFVVTGEGGIGKTRLLQDTRVQAQLRGIPFVLAQCAEGGPPLGPFAGIVHAVAALAGRRRGGRGGGGGRRGGAATDEARPVALDRLLIEEPALAALLGIDVPTPRGEVPDVESGDPDAGDDEPGSESESPDDAAGEAAGLSTLDRDRALDRLAEALIETTRDPFVLAIEDIHFADDTTLRAIEALARNLDYAGAAADRRAPRLMLLLTVRAEMVEDGSRLSGLLALAREMPFGHEVLLGGLDEAAQKELVGSMLAMREVPDALVREIRERAGGNPRFVFEILRALIEEDAVRLREGPTRRLEQTLAALGAPRSLAAVVRRRLERLEAPEQRQVLETLAIAFSPLPLDALSEATKLEPAALLELLEQHQRAGLVVQGNPTTRERNPPIHYALAHRTLRDGVLAGLDEERQTKLHMRVGLAVEALARRRARPGSRYSVDAALLVDLARHFERAGEQSRTFVYSVAAADHAARVYATEEAIASLRRALRAAGKAPEAPAEITWKGGKATTFARNPLDSSSDEKPTLLAADSGPHLMSRTPLSIDPDGPAGLPLLRLRDREPACRLKLGELLGKVGRAPEAERILGPLAVHRTGRTSHERRAAPEPVGFEPASDDESDDATGVVRTESATNLAPRALRALGDVRLRLGRLQAALEAYEASLDACTTGGGGRRHGDGDKAMARERIRSMIAVARVHLWRGDYHRAVTVGEDARALLGSVHRARETIRVLGVLAVAEYHRGRHRRAARYLRDVIEALRGDEREARRFLRRLAVPSVSEESFVQSLRYLESRSGLCRAVGDAYGITIAFTELGFLFDLRGTPADIQEHYERSLGIYERLADTEGVALSLNNLGVLARIRGDYGGALRLFERALAIQRESGDRQGETATLHNLGLVRLLAQDLEAATDQLGRCLELCRDIGIRWLAGYAQKAVALLERARGRRRHASALLRRAEGLFRQIGNPRALGDVLLDRAWLAHERERDDDALALCAKARASGEEEKAPDFLAGAELLVGRIALVRGKTDEAIGHLDSALSNATASGLVELEARVEAALGAAHERATRLRMAASHYDRAEEIERRIWDSLPAALQESYFRHPEREHLRHARRRVSERLLEDDY